MDPPEITDLELPQMLRRWDKLTRISSVSGPGGIVRFLFHRLLYRVWRTVVFEMRGQLIPQIEWQQTELLRIYKDAKELPKSLADLIRNYEFDLPEVLDRGGWVFVVLNEGECAHFGGVSFAARHLRILGEPTNTPIIGQCFTMPSARGKGLYKRALSAIAARLLAEGYKRILIETSPDNHLSRRGIEAAGFKLLREMKIHIMLNSLAVATIRGDGNRRVRAWLI